MRGGLEKKMVENDIEILEPVDHTSSVDEKYSHPTLVMSVLKKVIENRSKEMRDGYWNTKFDRLGNAHKVWISDSRREFIESVETLMAIQERDYDSLVKERIKKIIEDLDKKYNEYCRVEEKEWINLDYKIKTNLNMQGYYYRKGVLSEGLPFYKEYIRDKVDAYTKIVSEIQKSIKRIGEYGEAIYTA